MWKRRAVIVAITVVAAGAAVVSPASRRRHAPPVSYEQYTHIEKGMSPEEVEAIIGGRCRDDDPFG